MGSAYIPFDPWLLNLFKYLWLDDSGTGIDSDPEDNSDIDMDDIDSDASSVEGIYDFRYQINFPWFRCEKLQLYVNKFRNQETILKT